MTSPHATVSAWRVVSVALPRDHLESGCKHAYGIALSSIAANQCGGRQSLRLSQS